MRQLRASGYVGPKDAVLTETNALLRRHDVTAVKRFSDAWAKAVCTCRRDQISFDFLLHMHGVRTQRLPYASKPINRSKHTGNTRARTIDRLPGRCA